MSQQGEPSLRDEELYAAALSELESGTPRPGLWAKAFAESDGNESKSKALYIKLRVQQERDRLRTAQVEAQKLVADQERKRSASISIVVDELGAKGYRATRVGSGWRVREPLGGRENLSSDREFLEYAADRVDVPVELLQHSPAVDRVSSPGGNSAIPISHREPIASDHGIAHASDATLHPYRARSDISSDPSDGFFVKLSRGDYGLARTYWIYGVLVSVVISLLFSTIQSAAVLGVVGLFYFVYEVVVVMGIWRAATIYAGPKIWAVFAKIACIFGVLLMILGLSRLFDLANRA